MIETDENIGNIWLVIDVNKVTLLPLYTVDCRLRVVRRSPPRKIERIDEQCRNGKGLQETSHVLSATVSPWVGKERI